MKFALRVMSFTLVPLLLAAWTVRWWTAGLSRDALLAAAFSAAACAYYSYFLYRRSNGLKATFFVATIGPDKCEGERLIEDAICFGAGFVSLWPWADLA